MFVSLWMNNDEILMLTNTYLDIKNNNMQNIETRVASAYIVIRRF